VRDKLITYDPFAIDPTADVAETAIIGAPYRPLLDGRRYACEGKTVINANCWIGHYAMIGQGAVIGADSILEECVQVAAGAVVGQKVLLTSRSHIGLGAEVGRDCVIKGHIGDHCRVGDGCRIAGQLIHRQLDPTIPWDDPAGDEPSPNVEDGAFVGWGAMVVGGVNIGRRAYVCAGALVTRDVPPGHIACGRNKIKHPGKWPGALAKSPFFRVRQRQNENDETAARI
jgi:acetyltransferase-like isoleucine patch superfamily enzyme